MHNAVTVYEDLAGKIKTGWSGDLSEISLSSHYGVSRNTVKKSLLLLLSDGLIDMEPNKSARVKQYGLKDISEYLDIRIVLEGLMVRELSLTPDDFKKLDSTLATMESFIAKNDIISYSLENQAFHKILYDACINKTLVKMIEQIKLHTTRYSNKTDLVPGRASESYAEHKAIVDALRTGDIDKAEAAMKTHIAHIKEKFRKNYNFLI